MVSASMELHLSNIFLRSMIFVDLTIDKPQKQKSFFEFEGMVSLVNCTINGEKFPQIVSLLSSLLPPGTECHH